MNLTLGDMDVGEHKLYIVTTHNKGASEGLTIQFDIAPPTLASYIGIIFTYQY